MARIALILLLSFIFLSLHTQAREAPGLTGELRVRSIAVEDPELSRQISLSLRNPLGRRFHRGHRMPTSAIHIPGGCHHGPGPLRMYRLGQAIPVENYLQIVGDSGFGMYGSLEARTAKIKHSEKGGGDGFLSPFWDFLRGAFQYIYGSFTSFVRGDYY